MPGKFLIDLTEPRFKTEWNARVVEFIRAENPFAHSDVGSLLLEIGKGLPGAEAYCPSYASCAYVVLHDAENRMFAIAFGMTGLAYRLSRGAYGDALDDGGKAAPEIGPDWVRFDPWPLDVKRADTDARLRRWAARAFADVRSLDGDAPGRM